MKRHASAHWEGALKTGKGTLKTDSGVLDDTPYAFGMRFADEKGTNPEELIAAAHAGCFSMAFSGQLEQADITDASIDTKGTITFEKQEAGFRLLESHLDVRVKAPGADRAAVEKAAENAKTGCPVSNALKMEISMTLEVET